MIGSPISSESLAQASQADIVRAFEEMPDATGWNHPNRRMEGGNIQLAREFASFAREAPERPAAVLRDLTAETGTREPTSVVQGTNVSVSIVQRGRGNLKKK